jgi:hypothetical protein
VVPAAKVAAAKVAVARAVAAKAVVAKAVVSGAPAPGEANLELNGLWKKPGRACRTPREAAHGFMRGIRHRPRRQMCDRGCYAGSLT